MDASVFLDPGVLIVLAIRLIGPLMIFRYPLLGALLSEFVFDASDVIIWDAMGSLERIDYTAFDKPLDMYQLVIMAVVVWRWRNGWPRTTALALFAHRLIGFVLYETSGKRVLFLLYPNIFVPFFIAYLILRKIGKGGWFERPLSLAMVLLVLLALKLPQEYFLHYREIPTWDVIKGFLGIG